MSLSERQKNILTFVKSFMLDNGYPPTIREIGKAVSISSTSVVNYNLDALQRAGYISRDRTVSRGIRLAEGLGEQLTHAAAGLVRVPMLGRIAAGEPLRVFTDAPDYENTIELSRDLVSSQEGIYALEVQGTSMIDAFINDGDIVIMRHTESANNGEMVAAWLPEQEETTLKRFYHEGDKIRLAARKPNHGPDFCCPRQGRD